MTTRNLNNPRLYGPDDSHFTYYLPLEADDVEITVDLPLEYNIKDKSEDGCAWAVMGQVVMKAFEQSSNARGLPIRELSVSDIVVSKNTYDKLSRLTYYWLIHRNLQYLKSATERKKQSTFGMFSLNYSPCATDAPWAEDDKVYIRKER